MADVGRCRICECDVCLFPNGVLRPHGTGGRCLGSMQKPRRTRPSEMVPATVEALADAARRLGLGQERQE